MSALSHIGITTPLPLLYKPRKEQKKFFLLGPLVISVYPLLSTPIF